jgi:ATP-dependent Clp protease ATP-binding subunit ClpC
VTAIAIWEGPEGDRGMFERYTLKARRVIFFARYEASQFGSPYIETEHILLGLLREDKALGNRFLYSHGTVDSIRRQIESHTTIREKVSTSVDLPLSNECKRVLAYAAEEAERLGHKHLGTEHLLLGLLREENCFAQGILKERGIELETIRESLAKNAMESSISHAAAMRSGVAGQSIAGLFVDLTQKALDGALEPVVGRDLELDTMIEVLCKKERRNPMLLGERGAGKTAIVEALAQRIAEGQVPRELAQIRVLAISTEVLSAWTPGRERFEALAQLLGTVAKSENLILFVDGLPETAATRGNAPRQDLAGVLKFAMQEAEVRCIAAASERDYETACASYPGLEKVFQTLYVKQLDASGALAALNARKQQLEQFHEVTLAGEALECAVQRADVYLKEKMLPGKALELLDAASAAVKLRGGAEPNEIIDLKKKLSFIQHRLAIEIANHEFEKARFYQDEERKERENLAALRERHGLDAAPALTVGREDVEQIIAKWAQYPYTA